MEMKMKRYAVIAVLVALSSLSCHKTTVGPDSAKPHLPTTHESKLATLLDSLRYALDFPALAGAIVTDDSILDAQAVGCRRYGGAENVTVNDQFHLGSNTKAITAVLLGVLVDQGLVSWDSKLPSIFPEYASTMRDEYRNVTLRNVLSHSAGFMRDPNVTLHTSTPKDQRAEVVAWALLQPPAVPVGQYLYSNLGFMVAGAIAEKLTDRPYEDLLIERVLQPLGITTAGFGPMGTPGLEDQPLQHTSGHVPILPTPSADNPPIYSPAGRLHMSVGDWAKYAKWVLAAEAGHQTLLKPETARTLTTPVVPMGGGGSYALGWVVYNSSWVGGKLLWHNGSNTMNYSEAELAPDRRFGVLVATNQGSGSQADPLSPAVDRLINFYLYGH
jgi:CubicO group peptidase (beta-lactamase class C family)